VEGQKKFSAPMLCTGLDLSLRCMLTHCLLQVTNCSCWCLALSGCHSWCSRLSFCCYCVVTDHVHSFCM